MRGDNIEVGNRSLVDGQGFSIENGRVQRLFFLQFGVALNQHFAAVCLAVDVDEKHPFIVNSSQSSSN